MLEGDGKLESMFLYVLSNEICGAVNECFGVTIEYSRDDRSKIYRATDGSIEVRYVS